MLGCSMFPPIAVAFWEAHTSGGFPKHRACVTQKEQQQMLQLGHLIPLTRPATQNMHQYKTVACMHMHSVALQHPGP